MTSIFDVADSWAKQASPGRRGARVFYEGPCFYSYGYHFLAAMLHETPRGPVALLNAEKYSVSTGNHIRHAANAAHRHDIPCFCVPDSRGDHASAVERYVRTWAAGAGQAARARKNWMWHVTGMEIAKRELRAYERAFGLPCTELPPVPDALKVKWVKARLTGVYLTDTVVDFFREAA